MGAHAQKVSTNGSTGYRDALAAANIPLDRSLVVDGQFTYRSGLDAAEQLLGPRRPADRDLFEQ